TYQMPANVMQAGASPRAVIPRLTVLTVLRQQWRPHLDVSQQRAFAGLAPRAIEARERQHALRQTGARGEQQEERQQQGNVHSDRSECVSPDCFALRVREFRALVIVSPRTLLPKPK